MDPEWEDLVPNCTVELIPGDEEAGVPTTHRVVHDSTAIGGTMRLIATVGGSPLTTYRLTQAPDADPPTVYQIKYFQSAAALAAGFTRSVPPVNFDSTENVDNYFERLQRLEQTLAELFPA